MLKLSSKSDKDKKALPNSLLPKKQKNLINETPMNSKTVSKLPLNDQMNKIASKLPNSSDDRAIACVDRPKQVDKEGVYSF